MIVIENTDFKLFTVITYKVGYFYIILLNIRVDNFSIYTEKFKNIFRKTF